MPPGQAAHPMPPPHSQRPRLRAARQERGWSQAQAARELSALAGESRTAGPRTATAVPASLKTLLSRWENGHATPEPEYRVLLGTLYGCDPAELGLGKDDTEPHPAEHADAFTARIAEADAMDDAAVELLRAQFESTVRLDHRLGTAGAADALAAQVDRLELLADHTLPPQRRRSAHALLAAAALLAGAQERDRERPDAAWRRYRTARAAAHEAGRPDLAGRAMAGRARLLLDAGRADDAREMLDAAHSDAAHSDAAHSDAARWDAARWDAVRPDTTHRPDGPEFEIVLPHRSGDAPHRHTAAELATLEHTAQDDRQPVRRRAEALAALATTLHREGHPDAAEHARRAHLLALRIGSSRVVSLLGAPHRAPGHSGTELDACP